MRKNAAFAALAALAVVSGFFGGALSGRILPVGASDVPVINARVINLVDENGRALITLGVGRGLPSFRMISADGQNQLILGVTEETSLINLKGGPGVSLGLSAGKTGGYLILYDQKKTERLTLGVSAEKGAAGLNLFDEKHRIRAMLNVDGDRSTWALLDETGRVIGPERQQ